MSSTCNIVGCKNNIRLKLRHRQVVMPHVGKLQFHRPNPTDYAAWQNKINQDRDDLAVYKVSSGTRVCSNHFKGGQYCKGDTPALYLRGYPSWATNKQDLRRQLASLSDDIIRQVAAHIFLDLPLDSAIISHLFQRYGISSPSSDNTSISRLIPFILKEQPSSIADILCFNFDDLPICKVQEAVAIFKHGIYFDKVPSVNFKKYLCSKPVETPVESPTCVMSRCHDDFMFESCTPYMVNEWHNYCTEVNDGACDTPAITSNHNDVCMSQITKSCKIKKSCKKAKCVKEKTYLKNKNKLLQAKIVKLSHENKKLRKEKELLKSELKFSNAKVEGLNNRLPKRGKITVADIKSDDDAMKLHTGLPTVRHFDWLYNQVKTSAEKLQYWKGEGKVGEKNYITQNINKPGPKRQTSLEEELLITLMTLKLNLLEDHLAFLFGVSVPAISIIVSTWIPFLSLELSSLIAWPDADDLHLCYPKCFEKWDNVTAIIDCFEVPVEKPSHVEANSQTFSTYKNRPTVKFLLACSPGGAVSYISPAAGGNMSDVELVRTVDLPSKFKPGDACMADKGFRMEGDFIQEGVRLIIPPFAKKGKQFTDADNIKNKHIAHARIHVERVIGRVRDYAILNAIVPVSRFDLIGPAAKVCCALTNLKNSIV